jgi:hypothetical protein
MRRTPISIIVQYIEKSADETGTAADDTKIPAPGKPPTADGKADAEKAETKDAR